MEMLLNVIGDMGIAGEVWQLVRRQNLAQFEGGQPDFRKIDNQRITVIIVAKRFIVDPSYRADKGTIEVKLGTDTVFGQFSVASAESKGSELS